MPGGSKGQKRPADVIGNAIRVAKIATGEEEEDVGRDDGKDPAAKSLGAGAGRREQRLSVAHTARQTETLPGV